ncbi:MAG: hypothetical protein FWF10_11450 [Clostridiales bacterium]|nr:hypothetical protein [Clostridiales bacterium]
MKQSSESSTKDVLVHQIPKLQADAREQRKKESFRMIFNALQRRLETDNSQPTNA